MKRILFSILLIITIFTAHSQSIEPTWESLNARPYPQWFSDAKLGIFIHWGLYSVPAYAGLEGYGEWYLKGLMVGDTVRQKFQNRVFGNGQEDFQYEDFTRFFKGELFRPAEWARLFQRSGAKYVVLVSKHHDGYCLWDNNLRPGWNSVASGPHRDIVGELTEAVRAEGMKMGLYYSLLEWNNPMHRWTVDPNENVGRYVDEHMVPQFKELVTKYRPSLIFADGDWDNSAEQLHSAELISWYYNTVGDEAVVNDRWGNGNQHGFRTPEYSAGITLIDRPWAECRGLGRSFGLNRNEPIENYLTSDELIRHFATLVAAGGGMTLNVGPAADGQIPLLQQERLLDLGKWLEINGEAIYETRPYSHFYEMKEVEVKRTEADIDFDWKRNSPAPEIACDHFTAEWSGSIHSATSEKYIFEIESDDEVTVIIAGDTIIQYDGKTKEKSQAAFKLKKGQEYPIRVIFKEENLEAVAHLFWQSATQPREVVPATAFRDNLQARYSSLRPTVCYTTRGNKLYAIALDFPEERLVLHLDQKIENPVVTLLGCDKVLPCHYVSNDLIIDTTPLKYSDIHSTAAWTFRVMAE